MEDEGELEHLEDLLNLSSLELDDCPYIPDTKKLATKQINISRNNLVSFPMSFWPGFKKLIYLDLSHNLLTCLPKELQKLCFLKVLKASYNAISKIQVDFSRMMENLEILHLDHNQLDYLPATFLHLNLKFLKLDNNPLVQKKKDQSSISNSKSTENFTDVISLKEWAALALLNLLKHGKNDIIEESVLQKLPSDLWIFLESDSFVPCSFCRILFMQQHLKRFCIFKTVNVGLNVSSYGLLQIGYNICHNNKCIQQMKDMKDGETKEESVTKRTWSYWNTHHT